MGEKCSGKTAQIPPSLECYPRLTFEICQCGNLPVASYVYLGKSVQTLNKYKKNHEIKLISWFFVYFVFCEKFLKISRGHNVRIFFAAGAYNSHTRSASGTYGAFLESGLNAGRIMRPPNATSSMRCAIQPTIRAVAKRGVNISCGMPSIR